MRHGGRSLCLLTQWQMDAVISDNDSDKFKHHNEEEGESCHAMMALTVIIHSLNQTLIKYQRLMKHETLHYPRWLVNKFTLFIFSRVVTPHTGQDPGRGPGRPGTVIREIFWFIILWPEFPHSGLPCPPLVPGTEAWTIRTQFTQSCWHAHTSALYL